MLHRLLWLILPCIVLVTCALNHEGNGNVIVSSDGGDDGGSTGGNSGVPFPSN